MVQLMTAAARQWWEEEGRWRERENCSYGGSRVEIVGEKRGRGRVVVVGEEGSVNWTAEGEGETVRVVEAREDINR